MPNASTVFDWLAKDEDFAKRYAHARAVQADTLAEEIIEIADEASDSDSAAAARVQVEARKWIAAHLLPSKYGDKANETHVNTTVNNAVVLTDEKMRELQERRRAALE